MIGAVAAVNLFEVELWQAARMAPRFQRACGRGAIRAACQRATSKSLTAATASIHTDLAFVGGEGDETKDLTCVLLVPLPDTTIGRISSGRKIDYRETARLFRERSERRWVRPSH